VNVPKEAPATTTTADDDSSSNPDNATNPSAYRSEVDRVSSSGNVNGVATSPASFFAGQPSTQHQQQMMAEMTQQRTRYGAPLETQQQQLQQSRNKQHRAAVSAPSRELLL
jgi:hypothetical protein